MLDENADVDTIAPVLIARPGDRRAGFKESLGASIGVTRCPSPSAHSGAQRGLHRTLRPTPHLRRHLRRSATAAAMSTHNDEGSAELARDTTPLIAHRLEAFCDGVMAVVMTIAAFGLKTPAWATVRGLEDRLPATLVYVFSFLLFGIYWNNHHHLLPAIQPRSAPVMWTDRHLLFWLTLVPFATQGVESAHQRPLPAAVYVMVSGTAALTY